MGSIQVRQPYLCHPGHRFDDFDVLLGSNELARGDDH